MTDRSGEVYRTLVLAVIRQAMEDTRIPAKPGKRTPMEEREIEDARSWFSEENLDLGFWAGAAGFTPKQIIAAWRRGGQ